MADDTSINQPAAKPDPADARTAQFSRIAAWTEQRKPAPARQEETERDEETDAA
jgi:hypothetical protein